MTHLSESQLYCTQRRLEQSNHTPLLNLYQITDNGCTLQNHLYYQRLVLKWNTVLYQIVNNEHNSIKAHKHWGKKKKKEGMQALIILWMDGPLMSSFVSFIFLLLSSSHHTTTSHHRPACESDEVVVFFLQWRRRRVSVLQIRNCGKINMWPGIIVHKPIFTSALYFLWGNCYTPKAFQQWTCSNP